MTTAIPVCLLILILAVFAPAFQAAPVRAVVNAASQWPAQIGARGLAPGSRIIIHRGDMDFSGKRVDISIRAAKRDIRLPVLSARATTAETRLPDDLRPGLYELRVRAGESERALTLRVARSSFGLYSLNGKGFGPGRIESIGAGKARLFGEGLGVERNVEVLVAGRPAEVLSASRGKEGPDQITFEVPADATPGCYVPVQVRVAGVLSNTVTIPIAKETPCKAPAGQPLPSWFAGRVGIVALVRSVLRESVDGPDEVRDEVSAAFFEKSETTGLGPLAYIPPDGQCITFARPYDSSESTLDTLSTTLFHEVTGEGLDAGQHLAIHDGQRQVRIPMIGGAAGFYRRTMERPFFDKPALYVRGDGGSAIPPFAASAPPPAAFVLENRPVLPDLRIADGLAVKWKDATPGGTMLVIAATADPTTGVLATCHCASPAEAGALRIRPDYLAHLKSGAGSGSPGVLLLVMWPSKPDGVIRVDKVDRAAVVSLFLHGGYYVYR